MKAKLLLGSDFPEEALGDVPRYAEVYRLGELGESELDAVLPSMDCLLVAFWPERLGRERLSRMARLSMVQSVLAGVNQVPFGDLPPKAVVCSNAGGYSVEVGEFAWGLLLSAAKRIVKLDYEVRKPGYTPPRPLELGREIVVLRGKVLGILGYGGIGRVVAEFGKAFGMEVEAFSRRDVKDEGVASIQGRAGLEAVLRTSDAAGGGAAVLQVDGEDDWKGGALHDEAGRHPRERLEGGGSRPGRHLRAPHEKQVLRLRHGRLVDGGRPGVVLSGAAPPEARELHRDAPRVRVRAPRLGERP